MATSRHLNNAPITEALIDLRIFPPVPKGATALRQAADAVRGKYPQIEEMRGMEFLFQLAAGTAAVQKTEPVATEGFLCRSADRTNLVQFRSNGFTFNRLQPYTSWEEMLPEALRLWRLYDDIFHPNVVRVAVRYINRLIVPRSAPDLREYLTNPPAAPTKEGQRVTTFLSRVAVEDTRTGAAAILMQVRDPSLDPSQDVIVLDIDAFKVKAGNDVFAGDEIDTALAVLHDLKNDLFFSSVTEQALEPYL